MARRRGSGRAQVELRHHRDREPRQPADHRAVDADVLQVGPDVALELGDELLLLPMIWSSTKRPNFARCSSTSAGAASRICSSIHCRIAGSASSCSPKAHHDGDASREGRLQILAQPGAKLLPEPGDVAGERRALEHLVAHPVHRARASRVLLQPLDERRHELVEARAQLVVAVAAHLRDLGQRDIDDLQRRLSSSLRSSRLLTLQHAGALLRPRRR